MWHSLKDSNQCTVNTVYVCFMCYGHTVCGAFSYWLWFEPGLFYACEHTCLHFSYTWLARVKLPSLTSIACVTCLFVSMCAHVLISLSVFYTGLCVCLFIFLCWCCVWVHKCGFVMFLYGSKSVYVCGGMVGSLRIIILNIKQLEVMKYFGSLGRLWILILLFSTIFQISLFPQ